MARRSPVILAFTLSVLGLGCERAPIDISETKNTLLRETLGRGTPASDGHRVCIRYEVELPDGTRVLHDDQSCFTIGAGSVIDGIDDAVRGMKPGGRRSVLCPPHRHWGRQGYGTIPPNTTLTLHIEMRSVG